MNMVSPEEGTPNFLFDDIFRDEGFDFNRFLLGIGDIMDE